MLPLIYYIYIYMYIYMYIYIYVYNMIAMKDCNFPTIPLQKLPLLEQ